MSGASAVGAVAIAIAAASGALGVAAAGEPATVAAADAASARVRGDPGAGERVYARCVGCHALAYDRTGPRHCGLFGRRAGSVEGFDYSPAMKRSGVVWNAATLDRFLADPMGTLPGTTMGYAGVPAAKERADLIAYLARASRSEACRG